jgi:hypothetical protein
MDTDTHTHTPVRARAHTHTHTHAHAHTHTHTHTHLSRSRYETLADEVKIGDHYLRLLLEDDPKTTKIHNPLEFFTDLYVIAKKLIFLCVCVGRWWWRRQQRRWLCVRWGVGGLF